MPRPVSTVHPQRPPRFRFELRNSGFDLHWNGISFRASWDFEVSGEAANYPSPAFATLWGAGRRITVPAHWRDGWAGTISINLYQGFPGLVITGEIQAGETTRELDHLLLLSLAATPTLAEGWRWLAFSGHQGFCGSLGFQDCREEIPFSQDFTVLHAPGASLALCNLTFHRTNLLFQRRFESGQGPHLSAFSTYGGMELPAGQSLALEALLLLPESDPLQALESAADAVVDCFQPRFNPSPVGLYNQWYANWTPASNNASADLVIKGAEMVRYSSLYSYGICTLGSGVWHNRAAFGEEEPWPGQFPEGAAALCEQVHQMGLEFMHGGFWGKASECSTVFKDHPEWMAKDDTGRPAKVAEESWGACPSPYYILDITLPEVQAWMRRQWLKIRQASTGLYWLDFYGTGTGINLDIQAPPRLYFQNRQVSFPFETDRLLTGLIREAVGGAGVIGIYTSPTFNLIGLIDRARVALDCGALDAPSSSLSAPVEPATPLQHNDSEKRWVHLQAVARNLAANYFCHNRFWTNDPDPAMVGLIDRPETLEEARVRVMLAANSGGFITVGEVIDQIPPPRLALLKQILPAFSQAAQPLDLLQADIPGIYDLTIQTSWDSWHVVTLINWELHEKIVDLPFCHLGIGGDQLIFELWSETYLGKNAKSLKAALPPRCCRVFCIRPARPHPWLLATNLHVTQGAMEIIEAAWDWQALNLSGYVTRPEGQGSLFFHIPPPFQLHDIQINGASCGSHCWQLPLMAVQITFNQPQIRWMLTFSRNEIAG